MGRKLGWMMLLLALAVPACAAGRPGTISGFVRNSAGHPQMGAAVEVFTTATRAMTVFTDARGFFNAVGLEAGTYHVKVTAPSFLPALRENVSLRAGASVLVNVTLNTLFEAVQLLPQRQGKQDDDGWKWTLRSAANRPILRVVGNGPVVVSQSGSDDRTLKARLAFVAGSGADGFGSSGEMSTNFGFEKSLFAAGTLSVNGNVGYGAGPQNGVLRTTYAHRLSDGSTPEISLTVRHFASSDPMLRSTALQAMSARVSDSFSLLDLADVRLGTEYQMVQFIGHASAMRPFGSVDVHLSPDTVVGYRYASAEPNMTLGRGFDAALGDLGESGPRISMVERGAVLERARHQEVSVARRHRGTNVEVAMFSDTVHNTALTGAGDLDTPIAQLLPDLYSGTFTYNGGNLSTRGVRVVLQQKLPGHLTGTLNYSYGGVLDLLQNDVAWRDIRSSVHEEWRHSIGARLSGKVPATHTSWATSYRWANQKSLTPVDMFDASPGAMDSYWNVFIRQPIPGTAFLPAKMEALVDLRNLLAQGYVPVIGRDGHTLYLVQSARAVRGGVAFVF
ncbi:MAG: carboxypeptidase-like regulatory domain-containing protein [Terriglobales bacterium]